MVSIIIIIKKGGGPTSCVVNSYFVVSTRVQVM